MNELNKTSILAIADLLKGESDLSGIQLDIACRRASEALNEIKAANMPFANEDYLELATDSDNKPFEYLGCKFKKYTLPKKFEYVGDTGQKIKVIKNQVKRLNAVVSGLQSTAKATGTGVKITAGKITDSTPLFSATINK